ncbi:MAG TPA: hypothetical protein VHA11_11455 [Bryobacteraceae bacterium]|nr:hypothetical protein [Bryobacteraceae bacterium]
MKALAGWVLALCAAQVWGAGEPRMEWELKLAALAHEPARAAADVLALRFSPDGKWIAAVTSQITSEGDRSEVVLIPASGEAAVVRRLRFEGGIESTAQNPGIHWSPASDALAVATRNGIVSLVRLEGGERCALPRNSSFGGFLDAGLVLAADYQLPKDPASIPLDTSSLTVYGPDCAARETWKVRGRVRGVELSAAAGLIALGFENAEIRLLRRSADLEVAHVPERSAAMLRFGEKGTVLCKADADSRGALACYELASGQKFANGEIGGGAPFDVSLDNSIVLASDGTYGVEPMGGNERHGLRSWIVWDYRAGRELARLKYKPQRHAYAVSPVAMSPDGTRFAVGVRGAIRVYELPDRSLTVAAQ